MIDFDTITEAEAEAEIDRLHDENPEVTEAVIEATLAASPLAGPIRILRELVPQDAPAPTSVTVTREMLIAVYMGRNADKPRQTKRAPMRWTEDQFQRYAEMEADSMLADLKAVKS